MVQSGPGKPEKTGVFKQSPGKPGKARERLRNLCRVQEKSGENSKSLPK